MPYGGRLHLQKVICLSGAPLPPSTALAFAQQALDGVSHLHVNLVAHRDLKGENFVVRDPARRAPPSR